jgi:hypothetical protein
MTQLPKSFRVTCTADGRPAAGVPVLITLRMNVRNHYNIVIGLTEQDGSRLVDRTTLEREADASRNLSPSDYWPVAGPEPEFGGEIEVGAMSIPEVEAALRAYDVYHTVANYPSNYRADLEAGYRTVSALSPRQITTAVDDISSDAIGVRFVTKSVPFPAARLVPLGAG